MSKSFKLVNSKYIQSSSISHNKSPLNTLLDNHTKDINHLNSRIMLDFYPGSLVDNFNNFYKPGIYPVMSGNALANAPYSSSIYGVLVVLTNDGRQWRGTDSSSWMWQIFFNTAGGVYLRCGVNSTNPDVWMTWK